MCGITGFVGPTDHKLLLSMSERVAHRGPDDEGYLERELASIGHRRLAVIDPEHGHQPMSNPDESVHIVYNGEVHNFRELRKELEGEGLTFSTSCDTEVVLRAYEAWGTSCFRRFNGMWAVALLDERDPSGPRVVLSRDHLGVKPLYLANAGGRLLFASEIKAILASPDIVPAVDEQHLSFYLLTGLHNHDEGTFFSGITQVPPATTLTVTPGKQNKVESERYWEPRLSCKPPPEPAQFRKALRDAVERRLISDLTVGTCLSGGLDSSTIVTLMSELLRAGRPDAASIGERLNTFSAVFDGDPIDEQRYIEPVLEATRAGSYYVRPRSDELFRDLPIVVWHQDEPMVSSGPYAQFRTLAFARDHARVLLDGQGGDELLAGYVPHQLVYVRELLSKRRYREAAREAFAARDVLMPLVRSKLHDRKMAVKPTAFLSREVTSHLPAARAADHRTNRDLKERLLQDLTTYSLPPMLRYEDRNAMAHAIESRPPFLDQELVELMLSLPSSSIIHEGWSRALLRQAMEGTLPEPVRTRRKKVGFTTPEMRWFRAERAAVRGILRSPAFMARPYWDGLAVANAFEASCEGRLEESLFFWRVLNTEAWLRVFQGRMPLSESGSRPTGTLEEAGDALVPHLLGADGERAAALLEQVPGRARRHLFACAPDGRSVCARIPLGSLPGQGTPPGGASTSPGSPRPGDVLMVAGETVASGLAAAASDVAGGPVAAAVVSRGRPDGSDPAALDPGGPAPAGSVRALGSGAGFVASELEWLLGDDPFGTGGERAAAVLVRRMGTLA